MKHLDKGLSHIFLTLNMTLSLIYEKQAGIIWLTVKKDERDMRTASLSSVKPIGKAIVLGLGLSPL